MRTQVSPSTGWCYPLTRDLRGVSAPPVERLCGPARRDPRAASQQAGPQDPRGRCRARRRHP